MAALEVRLSPESGEAIRTLHPDAKRKVRAAIDSIAADPSLGDDLIDELEGIRRIRVGRLRVIYRISGRIIEVLAVGRRATIYVDLAARLHRDRAVKRRARGCPTTIDARHDHRRGRPPSRRSHPPPASLPGRQR